MKQIIIPVPDRPGVVADVTGVLGAAGVNIEDLDAGGADENGSSSSPWTDTTTAVRALHEAGYRAITEDALVLRIRNEPGALAKVAAAARRSLDQHPQPPHRQTSRGEETLVTLVAERPEEARELLRDCLVAL